MAFTSTLALFRLDTFSGTYTNSADPVQMPHNAASDQGLHCLFAEILIQNTI